MQPPVLTRSLPLVVLFAAGTAGAPALAQSVSGSMNIDARCAPGGSSFSRAIALGDDFLVARHGECPAPRFGGLASINDASCAVSVGRGDFLIDLFAHTDFFGTRDDAGTASAGANFTFTANDVVFTDVADPTRHGIVDVSLNLIFRARASTQGQSNCTPFEPAVAMSFLAQGPGGTTGGTYSQSGGSAPSIGGAFIGYPNDGSPAAITSPGADVDLVFPRTLTFILGCSGGVTYCDFPPAAVGDAAALLGLVLPRTGPVFNLPPGITVNSPSLHIVNNAVVLPCAADFNGDGAVNSQDFFDFLTEFFAGAPGADFNGDGAINSQDFFDFLTGFFAGC